MDIPAATQKPLPGQSCPRLFFPLYFLCSFLTHIFLFLSDPLSGEVGVRDRVALVGPSEAGDRIRSCRGCRKVAVREGSSKPLPWPFGPHVSG